MGVEHFLVAQLARGFNRLRHRRRGRLDVEHVAHEVLRRRVHDESAVPETPHVILVMHLNRSISELKNELVEIQQQKTALKGRVMEKGDQIAQN